MPFCPNCGTNNTGAFCTNCGSPVSAPPAGGAPPNQAPPPQYQQQYQQPPQYGAQPAGMTDNMAGTLCYLFGLITGIIFLAMAPYNTNPRIKFHAWQSIILNIAWFGFYIVLGILTPFLHIIAFMIFPLVGLCFFVLWLFLMFKAYSGEMFEIPVIGPIAKKQAGL
jgi:uncharacterized membrane protein